MVSKQEWLDESLKALRGKSLDSLNFKSGTNQTYTPFFHQEDKVDISSPLSEEIDLKLAETVNVTSTVLANQYLLEILDRGINAPTLIIENEVNNDDLEILFKGIEINFIQPTFHINNKQNLKTVLDFLSSEVNDKGAFSGGINLINDETIESSLLTDWAALKRHFIVSLSEDLSKNLLTVIQNVISIYDQANDIERQTLHNQIDIEFYLNNDFYNGICHLRALKLLLAHVLKSFNLNHEVPFQISIKNKIKKATTEGLMLIEVTNKALIAYLGGANKIDLTISKDATDKHGHDFLSHVSRNINHLLNYESQMTDLKDPALGSYALDNITNDIAKDIWTKI